MSAMTVHGVLARPRAVGALGVAGGAGALAVALHLRDPHVSGTWGVCPLFALTGIYCPGCGGLRAVNSLTDLDFGSAFHSNPLVFPVLALMVWAWLRWAAPAFGFAIPRIRVPRAAWIVIAVTVAVFVIARNLPGFPLTPGVLPS